MTDATLPQNNTQFPRTVVEEWIWQLEKELNEKMLQKPPFDLKIQENRDTLAPYMTNILNKNKSNVTAGKLKGTDHMVRRGVL